MFDICLQYILQSFKQRGVLAVVARDDCKYSTRSSI